MSRKYQENKFKFIQREIGNLSINNRVALLEWLAYEIDNVPKPVIKRTQLSQKSSTSDSEATSPAAKALASYEAMSRALRPVVSAPVTPMGVITASQMAIVVKGYDYVLRNPYGSLQTRLLEFWQDVLDLVIGADLPMTAEHMITMAEKEIQRGIRN